MRPSSPLDFISKPKSLGLLSLRPPTLCHMTTVLSSSYKAYYTSCCEALSEGLVIPIQPVHLQ